MSWWVTPCADGTSSELQEPLLNLLTPFLNCADLGPGSGGGVNEKIVTVNFQSTKKLFLIRL